LKNIAAERKISWARRKGEKSNTTCSTSREQSMWQCCRCK